MHNKKFDLTITSKNNILDFQFADIYRYRDLLKMFVKRDIITFYKQTILGPLWFFIQPIMTMLVYIVVFGNIAGISTDGIPRPLFYMSGIVIWNYFSETFIKTSDTFTLNASIFGKVYFPRLIVPLSIVISSMIKFFIQFGLFSLFYIFYFFKYDFININYTVIFIPLFIIIMAGLGLGFGTLFSSLTTKYRDLKFLLQFGVQLMMYASPIIYPMNSVSGKIALAIKLNPITHIIEGSRYALLGTGQFSKFGLLYSVLFMFIVLFIGIIVFNKTEKKFIDTV